MPDVSGYTSCPMYANSLAADSDSQQCDFVHIIIAFIKYCLALTMVNGKFQQRTQDTAIIGANHDNSDINGVLCCC